MTKYDDLVATGHTDRIQKVAHRFLQIGTALRAQAEMWCHGPATLLEFTFLYVHLKAYSRVPISCRRIEAAHSELEHVSSSVPNARFPLKAARVRKNDVEFMLDNDSAFVAFVVKTWRSRNLLANGLKGVVSKLEGQFHDILFVIVLHDLSDIL